MKKVELFDWVAVIFGKIFAPLIKTIGEKRGTLARFQMLSDQSGFQIRSVHYYEPTYKVADLPEILDEERYLPAIDMNEFEQVKLLQNLRFGKELEKFEKDEGAPGRFGWGNRNYQYGDGEIYYSLIRFLKPKRIIEIGSGSSTLLAIAATEQNKAEDKLYECEIICIEPYEMPWLEKMPIKVLRERVEDVNLDVFENLGKNDILFIDSSHVIRPFGDVLREYNEIVPSLSSGVWVHVHDIFTPRDYPELWLRKQRRLWNEQYLLEAYLAYNQKVEVMCALNWLKHNKFDELGAACPMLTLHPQHEPGAFWFKTK